MDGEPHAFSNQVLEIDRAFEDLARSGKLYSAKTQGQPNTNQYGVHMMPQPSRFTGISHYASQRQPNLTNSRYYNDSRGAVTSSSMEYAAQYYPPPPLQQQYSHAQLQGNYSRSLSSQYSAAPAGLEQSVGVLESSAAYSDGLASRYTTPSQHGQDAPRSFSPFGTTNTLPPLSRLNTGGAGSSGHSTTPSNTAAMSSSTSMLPPGYGRESFASVAPGHVHSRAHSITGPFGSVNTGYARDVLGHSRAQSSSQQSEPLRLAAMSSVNIGSPGVFSPTIGHSRAASISAGSNGTPSPSTATFNFFSHPTSTTAGSGAGTMQSAHSVNNSTFAGSRIAPIGRPSQASKPIPEAVDEPRVNSRAMGGTAFSSMTASSVTSPLSNGFTDGWLDQIGTSTSPTTTATRSTSLSEAQRKTLQSVWNN